MNLQDCSVLITGGGGRIGKFLAQELLNKVKQVVVIDFQPGLLNELPEHERLVKLQCNVTDPQQVNEVITTVFEQYGGVDVCINNAGIIHSEPLINFLSKDDKKHNISNWQKVIDVNLNGVFFVTSAFTERLVSKRKKGLIINISSIAAQGNAGQSAYSATKAAVEALTKTWSKELGMFKIRSVCIAPGFFNTESTKESLSEATLQKWQKAVPIQRFGELQELYSAVQFVIENDYFNGKILSIDGGVTI